MAVTQQFLAGQLLTASQLNQSSIPVVSATSDITAPFTGQLIFNTTDSKLYRYTGSTWTYALQQVSLDLLLTQSTLATVTTAQTTSSTSYTDLATVGPTVTLTSVGTRALVMFGCLAFSNSATEVGHYMSVAVSGATTIAASDVYGRISSHNNNAAGFNSMNFTLLTITPGSNTYTAKYKLNSATASTFQNRQLMVLAP